MNSQFTKSRSNQESQRKDLEIHLPFGFQGSVSQRDSHLVSRSRETRSNLLGEGCGHISDHMGESWRLVLSCTSVTHKDPWIHTCVCGIFPTGRSRSQFRLDRRLIMILD
jgi:hypothetical protein